MAQAAFPRLELPRITPNWFTQIGIFGLPELIQLLTSWPIPNNAGVGFENAGNLHNYQENCRKHPDISQSSIPQPRSEKLQDPKIIMRVANSDPKEGQ